MVLWPCTAAAPALACTGPEIHACSGSSSQLGIGTSLLGSGLPSQLSRTFYCPLHLLPFPVLSSRSTDPMVSCTPVQKPQAGSPCQGSTLQPTAWCSSLCRLVPLCVCLMWPGPHRGPSEFSATAGLRTLARAPSSARRSFPAFGNQAILQSTRRRSHSPQAEEPDPPASSPQPRSG